MTFRRILSLFLVLCFGFSLFSCNSEQEVTSAPDLSFDDVPNNEFSGDFTLSLPESADDSSSDTSISIIIPPNSGNNYVPASIVGSWECDKDISEQFVNELSNNPQFSDIIEDQNIKLVQTVRVVFDGQTMTVIVYVKNAVIDTLLNKLKGSGADYNSLNLSNYDKRHCETNQYKIEGDKLVLNGSDSYLKFNRSGNQLQIFGCFSSNGAVISHPCSNTSFVRISSDILSEPIEPYGSDRK